MKQKQPNAKIVESLENLKAEISEHVDTRSREIWFKINSCLYSQYPHNNHTTQTNEINDIKKAINTGKAIPGIQGIVIIKGESIGLWGDLKLVKLC